MSTPAWARLQQLEADEQDDLLTLQARRRQSRLRHWWGRRTWNQLADPNDLMAGGGAGANVPPHVVRTGAWCYLCRKPITTWSSRWPITEQARIEIDLHRKDHVRDALDSVTIEPEENR